MLLLLQVGGERYNLFTDCPQAKTATIVLRGGSEQFIDEADRSLHDAIMIVRRALKHAHVVAGGGAIDMEVRRAAASWAHARCCADPVLAPGCARGGGYHQWWRMQWFCEVGAVRALHMRSKCGAGVDISSLSVSSVACLYVWCLCVRSCRVRCATTRAPSPASPSCSSTPLPRPWR